jgi:hypothetical protein
LRKRKLTLPNDLPDRVLCVGRVEQADHDRAESDKAYANDEFVIIASLGSGHSALSRRLPE